MTKLKLENIHTQSIVDNNETTIIEFDYNGKHYKGKNIKPADQEPTSNDLYLKIDPLTQNIIISGVEDSEAVNEVVPYNSEEYNLFTTMINSTTFQGDSFTLVEPDGAILQMDAC